MLPSPASPGLPRVLALLAGVLAISTGCALSTTPPPLPPPPRPPAGPVQPEAVGEEAFARSVEALFRQDQPTAQRQSLLAGVVQRQMAHAVERLKARHTDRGLATVLGGLYLIRTGEYRPEMLQGPGEEALALAAAVVASSGDEGRAQALYGLHQGVLPEQHPARRDLQEHLDALQRWISEQSEKPGIGPAEAAGMRQRRAVARSLLEPTEEALRDARAAIQQWVDAGLVFQSQYRAAPRAPMRREEMVEGVRSISSGAATLTALLLRHGDIGAAAQSLDLAPFRQVAPQGLAQRLNAAAREDDPDAWRELLDLLVRAQDRDEETSVDRTLVQAAAFRVAADLYRRDPGSVDIALYLATALAAHGMPEVAPVVLTEPARKHPDARVLSQAIELVAGSMLREEESDDPASARRTFAASAALLELADQPSLKGRVRPSPARVRLMAAGIEARSGELMAAREQLTASARDEPTAEAWRALAEIARQLGSPKNALEHLTQLGNSPEAQRDPLVRADALLLASDLQRDLGAREKAREEALKAYQLVLGARQANSGGPANLARAERLLARVLDRLDDSAGAARASERALLLARGDARQFAVTALETMARAYVSRDLKLARKVGQDTFGVQLRDDELVYVALWLQTLERELGARPDGTAVKLLDSVEQGTRWSGRLASWAQGKLSSEALSAAARTPGQRTEALFYRALAQRAAGKTSDAEAGLREVVKAPTLDLMEAQIARDLLAGNDRKLPGPLPSAAP
jgi:tetratricopeptide (TPR) repeat protein